MTSVRPAHFRSARGLVIVVAAALVAACSNAAPSPTGAATANTGAAASAASQAAPTASVAVSAPASVAPVASAAGLMSLRVAPGAPCHAGGTDKDCIAPGRYLVDDPQIPGTISFTVPSGWFEWDQGGGSAGVLVDASDLPGGGSGWGLLFAPIGHVPLDACDATKGSLSSKSSVDEVVGAMAHWPGFKAVGVPKSISIDGFSGKLIALTFTKPVASCPSSSVWTTPFGTPIDAYPMVDEPSRPAQFRILDVNGALLGIRTTDYPEVSPYEAEQGVRPNSTRHAADQRALRAMVDSIRITP